MGSQDSVEPGRSDAFVTTRWSVVLLAGENDSPGSQAALEELCRIYWFPVYAYVRRQGHSAHDAQDLTQEFFSRLLQKEYLRRVTREKGKFRTFLLLMVKRFLADEWDKHRALKRGGGQVFAFDFTSAEAQFLENGVDHLDPERLFEQRWALEVLRHVYGRMEQEYSGSGRSRLFETLRFSLTATRSEIPYRQFALELGMTEGAVKVAVHRLRQRYRELLRNTILETVSTPSEVEDELRHMLAALSGSNSL